MLQMCGPTGVGFLYGKSELLSAMPPFLGIPLPFILLNLEDYHFFVRKSKYDSSAFTVVIITFLFKDF